MEQICVEDIAVTNIYNIEVDKVYEVLKKRYGLDSKFQVLKKLEDEEYLTLDFELTFIHDIHKSRAIIWLNDKGVDLFKEVLEGELGCQTPSVLLS